jgi:hypothetical protein
LEADGIASSHPLSIGRPVQKLSEIDNWFDDIEYSKGGAVLRMLRAWLNRANAPMLGLDFSSASSSSSSSGSSSGALQQHARRLQQTLSQYLPDSPMAGTSSSSSEGSSRNDSSWWLQHQKEHAAGARQPLLPTLLPSGSSFENGSTAGDSVEQSADADSPGSSGSSSSSSSGSAAWWTKRAHIGVANADLVKGAAAAAGQESQLKVLPAGDGVLATPGYEGIAGLEALGAKDPFIKGLRTYLQVRVLGDMPAFCCCNRSKRGQCARVTFSTFGGMRQLVGRLS